MRISFYWGIFGLVLFEFLKVYFIMPLPGSQRWATLDFAYFLHQYRWIFRTVFLLLILIGAKGALSTRKKWIPMLSVFAVMVLVSILNFRMSADSMFKEPENLSFQTQELFTGNDSTLVIAVTHGPIAKAYPVRYIVYHHQIRDSLGNLPIMVTYCSVCRTGRIFSPEVNGKQETFRLVGMDYFNAMFEDESTGSWWQQATGEAIAGPLKGQKLMDLEVLQMSASTFFSYFPHGSIMEADPVFLSKYDSLGKYERGKSDRKLTGTDPYSWNEKSWVIGVELKDNEKAYDWNQLKETQSIRDQTSQQDVLLLLAKDTQSFVAFELPEQSGPYSWTGDTLYLDSSTYLFTGKSMDPNKPDLKRLKAYQEFWHSWKTFRPGTKSHN